MEVVPLSFPAYLNPIIEEVFYFRCNALFATDRQFQTIADGRSGLFVQLSEQGHLCLESQHLPTTFIWGASSRYTSLSIEGNTETLAIILKPIAIKAAFGADAIDFTNSYQCLDWVSTNFSAHLLPYHTLQQNLQLIYTLLYRNYQKYLSGVNANVLQALHLIKQADGNVSIRHLSNQMNISERTLQRLFISQVGLSPKLFARIQRFQKIVTLLKTQDAYTLTRLSHAFDYADQSHFIREFKEFSGFTPTELPKRKDDLI